MKIYVPDDKLDVLSDMSVFIVLFESTPGRLGENTPGKLDKFTPLKFTEVPMKSIVMVDGLLAVPVVTRIG